MQAITYGVRPVGWITCRWLRHLWPGCLRSRVNGLRLRDLPAPPLPGDNRVRLRTRMAGICGTDVSLLAQKQPPDSILQAFSTLPTILGHENVAEVVETGEGVDPAWVGRRVCVEPTLCCEVRGIDPPCERCAAGEYGACENFADPASGAAGLGPGTSIGYCGDAGGAFAEEMVAHRSQLIPVPDSLSDEQAILVDPLACSLHAVLRADLSEARRVLVYGAGVLGLGVIACLRAIGYDGTIDALDTAAHVEPLATARGADAFFRLGRSSAERFGAIAERTGGTVQRSRFGNCMLSGGYDVVFECVGATRSLEEALKWTRSRGQTVLVATGTGRGADLTPVWFTELTVLGAYGRQMERYDGRRVGTYALTMELMEAGKLNPDGMLTHTYRLGEYRRAFETAMNKARFRAIKVAFDMRDQRERT